MKKEILDQQIIIKEYDSKGKEFKKSKFIQIKESKSDIYLEYVENDKVIKKLIIKVYHK